MLASKENTLTRRNSEPVHFGTVHMDVSFLNWRALTETPNSRALIIRTPTGRSPNSQKQPHNSLFIPGDA